MSERRSPPAHKVRRELLTPDGVLRPPCQLLPLPRSPSFLCLVWGLRMTGKGSTPSYNPKRPFTV